MTRQIFNERLKQEDCTSTIWRRIRIKVIHKKGDVEEAGNYIPISTLPALYKLFFDVIVQSVVPETRSCATRDQGGFRRSFQTLDHLAGLKIAEQKCQEWGVKMWISTVDFLKAFDSISHRSLWDALGHCEIEPQYVGLFDETTRETEKICLDRQRERRVRNREGDETGRPAVQVTLEHSVTSSIER